MDNNTLSPRKGGQLKGHLEVSDDFDEPLPSEIQEQFYSGPDSSCDTYFFK